MRGLLKTSAMLLAGGALVLWAGPPLALVAGVLSAMLIQDPLPLWAKQSTKWLLQLCVVLLGFNMDLPLVLRTGLHGSLFAALTISTTLLLGYWLGGKFGLGRKSALLISAGTAICGGSAIAAVATVISASEAEIAVSIGTVFLLNAAALYIFPLTGHLLNLSQPQFGLWAGVAIHDISSVVGAGLSYGPQALDTATAVKLSRTLWILPVTFALAFAINRRGKSVVVNEEARAKATIPWFIALFLLASLARSISPFIASVSPQIAVFARKGMVLVLFLIGASLSPRALKSVGWRTAAVGVLLWLFISISSLMFINSMFPSQ